MKTDNIRFDELKVGDQLPAREIPITPALVVGGAIASRDYTPVHHDRDAAQAQGLPDIFMNILTSNGLMGSYATNWAGPDATLKKIELKLGAPNCPGDTMTLSGTITAKNEQSHSVDIDINGVNRNFGVHMAGAVTLELAK